MGAYDKFRVDTDLESKGVILDYGDFRVTISRAGGTNKAFDKCIEKKTKPYLRAIQTETMSEKVAQRLLREAFAETIIVNWELPGDEEGQWVRGIEDPESGEVLEFSPDEVLKVISHPELGDLWADLRDQAQKGTLFRASIDEIRAGN